jgi:DNA modification methylase
MIINADAMHIPLADNTVQCVVSSPPYFGLRDYQVSGQIGMEESPEDYVMKLVEAFREVKRVLKDDGTLWLNIGDSYGQQRGNGFNTNAREGWTNRVTKMQENCGDIKLGRGTAKPKDLLGIPWMVAFALRDDGAASPAHMRDIQRMINAITDSYDSIEEWPDKIRAEVERLEQEYIDANRGGWYLRSEIIWSKPNPMPESVKDRPTKNHEYIFLLTKSPTYYYNYQAILEPAAYDGRKDTKYNGGRKYKNYETYNRSRERWPNKIRGYKDKAQIDGTPQHHGGDIVTSNRMTSRKMADADKSTGGAGGGFKKQSGGYDVETGEWLGSEKDGVPARNKRSVWTISTQPTKEMHYAVMPEKLVEPCILAGSRPGDLVFDPFMGSGTVGRVAIRLGRRAIGTELNYQYIRDIAIKRTSNIQVILPMEKPA